MKRTKFFLSFFLSAGFFYASFAQHRAVVPYHVALGLRGGFLDGLSLKGFLNTHSAIEGLVGTRWQGVSVTGLYEYQVETKMAEDIDWFVGFGGHGGYYNQKYFLENGGSLKKPESVYAVGVDAIIGIEWRIKKVPLTLGIDFKPYMDLVNSNSNYLDAGLTLRYVIN